MNPADNKPAGQEMVFDKYVAIALVVGIIAGFIIGNSIGASKAKVGNNASSTDMVFEGDATSTSNVSANGNQNISAPKTLSSDGIEVSDQKAGHTVVVEKLILDKSYWVAVRDSQSTTAKPYVLGTKRLQAGTHTNVSIYVSRATEAGKMYDIVFYKDLGNFNYDSNLIVMDGDNLVGATFKAN